MPLQRQQGAEPQAVRTPTLSPDHSATRVRLDPYWGLPSGVPMAGQAVDLGAAAGWAGAGATLLVVITTSLVALGFFDRFKAPRLVLTFAASEPWCRRGSLADGRAAWWVRIGVENRGKSVAYGCVGRLTAVATAGLDRDDVDPVQLRWAGSPRSRAFDPIEIRPGQREYLNVLVQPDHEPWRLVTFEDPDFDPGFTTELDVMQVHRLRVAVFSVNASTQAALVTCPPAADGSPSVRLVDPEPHREGNGMKKRS